MSYDEGRTLNAEQAVDRRPDAVRRRRASPVRRRYGGQARRLAQLDAERVPQVPPALFSAFARGARAQPRCLVTAAHITHHHPSASAGRRCARLDGLDDSPGGHLGAPDPRPGETARGQGPNDP
eukprot:scaffold3166_cov399-Prasinococcus_capsulatus_cf.AAC.15